jgi:hypothetical protein
MKIDKLKKLQEVFDALEAWEVAYFSLEEATEKEVMDLATHIEDVEESRLKLIVAWGALKWELQKEKEEK